ncbi:MAG: MBL fold metallo-hydrolase [Clostridia bacterium]|nr:MBL fold metallo-hydrolase [Clostridia bacterium]
MSELINLALRKIVNARTSIEAYGWGKGKLVDGREKSDLYYAKGFSSGPNPVPDKNEWVEVDLGADCSFNQIKLFPRSDILSVNGLTAGFPVDYSIQVKPENGVYSVISSVTGQQDLQGNPRIFSFETLNARYVKVNVTKLGNPPKDEPRVYRFQLAELEIFNIPIGEPVPKKMLVHTINVGYGDSILIQTPNGKTMLIDSGRYISQIEKHPVINHLKAVGINRIDTVLSTHPHTDHAGGQVQVLESFDFGKVILPSTVEYPATLRICERKGAELVIAKTGTQIGLDPDVTMSIIAPNGTNYYDSNNKSIVVKMKYGNTGFLFAADAVHQSQKEMISKGYDLKSDFLKVAHHGLWDSMLPEFFQAVSPKHAVISTSDPVTNLMNIPTGAALQLADANIETYITSLSGTVIATSDGNNIGFDKNPTTLRP